MARAPETSVPVLTLPAVPDAPKDTWSDRDEIALERFKRRVRFAPMDTAAAADDRSSLKSSGSEQWVPTALQTEDAKVDTDDGWYSGDLWTTPAMHNRTSLSYNEEWANSQQSDMVASALFTATRPTDEVASPRRRGRLSKSWARRVCACWPPCV